jgi:putative DNA primase/helicase
MPELKQKPTRGDALAALALFDELLIEFAFVDEPSKSVALSALITPVVRGAMGVTPLHAFRAPVAGSGKSYLVDVSSAITTGNFCPVIAAGRTEEETEKRLGGAMLAGYPLISIDNLNGELGGDCLCQLVERRIVSVRALGGSKLYKIESGATVFATGNNIQPTGDIIRRVIMCSLDPNMERPEQREFKGDPVAANDPQVRVTYVLQALADRAERLKDYYEFRSGGMADFVKGKMKRVVILPGKDPVKAAKEWV